MEDTIQDMAGFIPLTSLGKRLLSDLSDEQFGNFKSSLVGLLGAYNYELSILQVQPWDSMLLRFIRSHSLPTSPMPMATRLVAVACC